MNFCYIHTFLSDMLQVGLEGMFREIVTKSNVWEPDVLMSHLFSQHHTNWVHTIQCVAIKGHKSWCSANASNPFNNEESLQKQISWLLRYSFPDEHRHPNLLNSASRQWDTQCLYKIFHLSKLTGMGSAEEITKVRPSSSSALVPSNVHLNTHTYIYTFRHIYWLSICLGVSKSTEAHLW